MSSAAFFVGLAYAAAAIGVAIYLVAALLRPEKF